jgi:ribosomal protein L40E
MQDALSDLVRCPSCGASNPADSAWCGQCHQRFGAEVPSNGGPSDGARSTAPDHGPFAHPSIATRDGAVVWTCPACDGENPLEATACARCGSSFAAFFAGPTTVEAPRPSSGSAVWASALLPGAGHWIHRAIGPAVARAIMYLWTLGIAIMLLARPPATGRAVVRGVGAIFALAAAAVWLLSMLETMRMREGDRRPLIQPRVLTWFSAGLSGLLLFGLLGVALAGRN